MTAVRKYKLDELSIFIDMPAGLSDEEEDALVREWWEASEETANLVADLLRQRFPRLTVRLP